MAFQGEAGTAHHAVITGDGLRRYALTPPGSTVGTTQVDLPEIVVEPAPLHWLNEAGRATHAPLQLRVGAAGAAFEAVHRREGYGAVRTELLPPGSSPGTEFDHRLSMVGVAGILRALAPIG